MNKFPNDGYQHIFTNTVEVVIRYKLVEDIIYEKYRTDNLPVKRRILIIRKIRGEASVVGLGMFDSYLILEKIDSLRQIIGLFNRFFTLRTGIGKDHSLRIDSAISNSKSDDVFFFRTSFHNCVSAECSIRQQSIVKHQQSTSYVLKLLICVLSPSLQRWAKRGRQ